MPKDFKLYYAAQGNLEEVQRILDLGDVNINMEYYTKYIKYKNKCFDRG